MSTTRLKFSDYEAWIVVGDKETEIYGTEIDAEKKTVTCWIASEEGKHFTIWGRKTHTKFGCSFRPSVDGLPVRGSSILPSNTNPACREGVPTSFGKQKLFEFSPLEVTDDDTYLESAIAQGVGEIRVDLHRSKFVKKRGKPGPVGDYTTHELSQSYKVHEKSKKAMAHRVQCTKEVERAKQSNLKRHSVTLFDVVASFVFRYRSLDMLQANGIAPRPTPPETQGTSSLPGKRNITQVKAEEDGDEDEDYLVQTQRQLDHLLSEASRLKADLDARQLKGPPRKKVKKEAKTAFLSGEVIDLT